MLCMVGFLMGIVFSLCLKALRENRREPFIKALRGEPQGTGYSITDSFFLFTR